MRIGSGSTSYAGLKRSSVSVDVDKQIRLEEEELKGLATTKAQEGTVNKESKLRSDTIVLIMVKSLFLFSIKILIPLQHKNVTGARAESITVGDTVPDTVRFRLIF